MTSLPARQEITSIIYSYMKDIDTFKVPHMNYVSTQSLPQLRQVKTQITMGTSVEAGLNSAIDYIMSEINSRGDDAVKVNLYVLYFSLGYFYRRYMHETPKETEISSQAEVIYNKYADRIEELKKNL